MESRDSTLGAFFCARAALDVMPRITLFSRKTSVFPASGRGLGQGTGPLQVLRAAP